jgi:hypothetical protein
MRISHKRKFLFLSLPRAASLTIRKTLDPYSDVKSKKIADTDSTFPFWHHTKAIEAKKIFERRGWKWKKYKKFCLIRNPYDRVVSAYKKRWQKDYGLNITGNYIEDIKSALHDILLGPPNFEEFVQKNDPSRGYAISIENFAFDKMGNKLVDDILMFEKLPSILVDYVNKEIGLDIEEEEIGHYHESRRNKSYEEWYNDRTKMILKRQYKMEFEKFDYQF